MDDDGLDLCVPLVLDPDGWNLFLRDPQGGSCLLVAFEKKREAAEAKRQVLRRTLAHILEEDRRCASSTTAAATI